METILSNLGASLDNLPKAVGDWVLYASANQPLFVGFILAAVVILFLLPFIRGLGRRILWCSRVWRKRVVGKFKKISLRMRIEDLVLNEIDNDYLAGKLTAKQRRHAFIEYGLRHHLTDLFPRSPYPHPDKVKEASRRALATKTKPVLNKLVEAEGNVVPLKKARRLKIVNG